MCDGRLEGSNSDKFDFSIKKLSGLNFPQRFKQDAIKYAGGWNVIILHPSYIGVANSRDSA